MHAMKKNKEKLLMFFLIFWIVLYAMPGLIYRIDYAIWSFESVFVCK